jgi:hypothetical protein
MARMVMMRTIWLCRRAFQQPHHSLWNLVSFLLNAVAVPLPPDAAPMRAES